MAQDELKPEKILVIGGSAGSLEVMLNIIAALPSTNNFAVIVIVHRKNTNDSILSDLIAARTKMNVREVEDKMPITSSTVFLAPSDYHLLAEDEQYFSLDASEKIHFSRPSIDVGFESIAEVFEKKVIAVLLSGANADGANGIKTVHELGGITVVQSPETADVSFMPQQAINSGYTDHIIDAGKLPSFISKMIS